MMLKGSCLCGTVAFECGDLSGPIGHCHCTTCRKAHAAAFATTARVSRDDFKWVQGEDQVAAYESSPGKNRHFCKNCGTHLMAAWTGEPSVILRLGCLDTDPGKTPKGHIWTSHAVSWLDYGPDLPMFPQTPPAQTEKPSTS